MSGRTFIHINGRQYDAYTGRPVPTAKAAPMVDSLAYSAKSTNIQSRPQRQPASHTSKSVVQKSQLLARNAVKKPLNISAPRSTQELVIGNRTVSRSTHAPKSEHITKFAPRTPVTLNPVHPPQEGKHYYEQETFAPRRKGDVMVDEQLEHATAHIAIKSRKKASLKNRLANFSNFKRRALTFSAGFATILLLGGFIVYNSLSGISLSIANRRAGFSAALPEFTPDGYSLNVPISYGPGKVVISFKSNTNDKNYKIEQSPTGWSLDTLREQITAESGGQYQTYQVKDITLFFTKDNRAMWIDNGILFALEGNSGLSGDQIASIATSM